MSNPKPEAGQLWLECNKTLYMIIEARLPETDGNLHVMNMRTGVAIFGTIPDFTVDKWEYVMDLTEVFNGLPIKK